jgi:aminomethyltransferase
VATGSLLRTSLYATHLEEGARMVDFAGWEMPLQYRGIVAEHEAVRTSAGVFDLSHMGELEVSGPGAVDFVNGLITNDLAPVEPGRALYTAMCRPDGGILDDMVVYRFPDRVWLVVNASNREKIRRWVEEHLPPSGVALRDLSLETALVALQGPRAQELLAPLVDLNLDSIGYYRFAQGHVAGVPALISRTGYTGEDGFELYVAWQDGPQVWRALRQAGAPPCGLGARDTLRTEAGYALYGHEIDEVTNPLEAGLGWVVKLGKAGFVGKEALEARRQAGLSRALVGLLMESRAVPRPGYSVEAGGREVGRVTSGTFSPTLSRGIALASVELACRSEGTPLEVVIRGRREPARVVKLPFVKGSVRR